MAFKKPLVLYDGHIGQIQDTDTLDVTIPAFASATAINEELDAIVKGTPVYTSSAGKVKKAKADAPNTAEVLGLVKDDSIPPDEMGTIQLNGLLNRENWTEIIGEEFLDVGAEYFLSKDEAGKLTKIPPTTSGNYLVYIGRATSPTTLEIDVERKIIL